MRTEERPSPDSPYDPNRSVAIRAVRPSQTVPQRIKAIWDYRALLNNLVMTEIKVKYMNSFLGFIWSLLNPAMMILIYFIVFQKILKNGIPMYAIFIATGLLCWNLFQAGVQNGTGSVVANAGLVKKVSFPREILGLASVGSAFIFFLFQLVVLFIFLAIFRQAPDPAYLWLTPIALFALVLSASGFSILLSAFNVYLRDVRHLVEVLMVAWFWGTPVVYAYEEVSKRLAAHGILWLYYLNPATIPVLAFQRAFYVKTNPPSTNKGGGLVPVLPHYSPEWYLIGLGILIAASAVFFLFSVYVFGRLEGNFVEEL